MTPLLAVACALTLAPSSDYGFLVGSGVNASWKISRNGQVLSNGEPVQRFLRTTIQGAPSFPRLPALPLDEGTLEMRVALREDGDSDTFTKSRNIFYYEAANKEYLAIAQSGSAGILYFGGTVGGEWQSAYSGRGYMRGWKAGEWHHLAAAWSASRNRMKFYVDGVLAADSNERHYWPPAGTGAQFTLDSTTYAIRDAVTWGKALDDREMKAHAARSDSPREGEIWFDTSGFSDTDTIRIESGQCASAPFAWTGVPILDPQPASMLLPPGTTELDLSVQTSAPAECRYAVNRQAGFDEMTPLAGRVTGLSADPRKADEVFVRCSNAPDYALRLLYRSLPRANPTYPRKSNLWGSSGMLTHGYDFASKVDVYLGAEMTAADIRALRERNREIVVLTSINTVENHNLPEDYYLHDTHGNKIEVWPGTYRLNLTKPYVAEYQAKWAYQKMVDSDLMYDGCFFDNFFTSQSWLKADIHGNPVAVDADEDGKPDDPVRLDAAWREGVFNELAMWRRLMPYAYASGHLPNPVTPEVGDIFNGNSILFWAANVQDGKVPFSDFWNIYQGWSDTGRTPVLSTVEASPQNQIAYGYGYDILKSMPDATQRFARDYYPYMRFGLAATLMRDGSFHRDFGDIHHGIDWWYDEYDFNLGYPTGAAELIPFSGTSTANLLVNSGFEQDLTGTWNLTVDSRGPAKAALAQDADAREGRYSARIDVIATSLNWHVDFNQRNRALEKGKTYELSFWARSSTSRTISLASQKGAADFRSYGLSGSVSIGTEWKQYTVAFEANETAADSRIQFFVGDKAGTVWLDGIVLREIPPQVWRRYFTGGAVILNGTKQPVTVEMPAGYARFRGEQAARFQYIVDDEDSAYAATAGSWQVAHFDTGQWKSNGPYYHHWGMQCRVVDGAGSAEWDLRIPEDGAWSVEVWWAAAPEQTKWTDRAIYELWAGGVLIDSAVLDQRLSGDQWRKVFTARLRAGDRPVLRIRNGGTGRLVADAVHVWSESRYNDGSGAPGVTLAPMDGILLRRTTLP